MRKDIVQIRRQSQNCLAWVIICFVSSAEKDGVQVCGARGAGSAAAQGVFLAMRPHEVYMLVSLQPSNHVKFVRTVLG